MNTILGAAKVFVFVIFIALGFYVSEGFSETEAANASYFSGQDDHVPGFMSLLSRENIADDDFLGEEGSGWKEAWHRRSVGRDDHFSSQTMRRIFDLLNAKDNDALTNELDATRIKSRPPEHKKNINEKCTYYASGRIESKIIIGGDSSEEPVDYYHYNDDALSTVSHKILHTTRVDGTRAFCFEYDGSGRRTKETGYEESPGYHYVDGVCYGKFSMSRDGSLFAYSLPASPNLYGCDKSWTNIFSAQGDVTEKYTYYIDNRIEYHIVYGGDAFGVEYYHYYNTMANQVSHKVLHTALADGTKAYYYEYSNYAEKITDQSYSGCDYTDPKAPSLEGYYIVRYNQCPPRWSIYTYAYVYMEEDFYGPGKGRLLSVTRSITHSSSTWQYQYWEGTDKVSKITWWGTYGYGPIEDEYAIDGLTLQKTTKYRSSYGERVVAEVDTFYSNAANRLRSKTGDLYTGAHGYEHYIDELFEPFDKNGNGAIEPEEIHGRVDIEAFDEANDEGAFGYVYTYFEGSRQAQYKDGYSTVDHSDPDSPTYSGLVVRYEYDPDGTLKFKHEYDKDGKEKTDIKISEELASKQLALQKHNEEFNGTGVKEDGFVNAPAK